MRPTVSGVFGRCTVMKSAAASSSSRPDEPHAELAGARAADVGVVGDDVHAEGRQPLRDEDADPAEAHDTDGLLEELDAGVLRTRSTCRP